ncbi:permease [Roseimaritima sediminicola]|uniref:permease n=1 Tax=Roseimaritima sediminicola TaxID=2662066 RepID=UPI0036F26C02
MNDSPVTTAPRYRWARSGDINAFFGLMLDNVAGLILMVSLLAAFGMPAAFVVETMVPGTALGVLLGDLAFFYVALRLARRTGRDDVTAMPLGLDTPSTFGMVYFVLAPAFQDATGRLQMPVAEAAVYTWHIGIVCVVACGLFKLICAPLSERVRRWVPRAALLGSLAAIALVLISFMPLMEIFRFPVPGLIALAIVLTSLIGRIRLPLRLPGTVGALVVAGTMYYVMVTLQMPGYAPHEAVETTWMPSGWLDAWTFAWTARIGDALPYLPVALPFALVTVVGGIDCTESAAAGGDQYDTRTVIGVEAVATLLAGLSGGVIQTTPYIGHPAYKAMGGRAAYTLATALVIGSAGLVGYFGVLYRWIPAPAVYPILVFIGLEISSQSFLATPRRHYPAVALACLPALAFLALHMPGRMMPAVAADQVAADVQRDLLTMRMLSNSFILTSLLWAWALVAVIDRRLLLAAAVFAVTGVFTLFGVIHSPATTNSVALPFGPQAWAGMVLPAEHRGLVYEYAAGYLAVTILLLLWAKVPGASRATDPPLHDG